MRYSFRKILYDVLLFVCLLPATKSFPQAGQVLATEELLDYIIESERKIRDVQVHMTCTIPEKRFTSYEYDWGYKGGKEFFNGLHHYTSDGKPYQTLKEFTAFDGDKQRMLRYLSDGIKTRGAVHALRPETFRTMITPNTLLGFDAKEISRQSFGEAMAGAESVRVREEIEEIDGHPCLVIEAFMVETDPVVKTLSYDVRAWIDTKRDFRLLKFEKYRSVAGKNRWKVLSRRVENIKLKLINGIWFPVEGDRTTFTIKDETPPEGMTGEEFSKLSMEEQRQVAVYEIEKLLPAKRLRIDVNSIKINEGIPPEKFNIKFPPGCVVWDDFIQEGYTVGGRKRMALEALDDLDLDTPEAETIKSKSTEEVNEIKVRPDDTRSREELNKIKLEPNEPRNQKSKYHNPLNRPYLIFAAVASLAVLLILAWLLKAKLIS